MRSSGDGEAGARAPDAAGPQSPAAPQPPLGAAGPAAGAAAAPATLCRQLLGEWYARAAPTRGEGSSCAAFRQQSAAQQRAAHALFETARRQAPDSIPPRAPGPWADGSCWAAREDWAVVPAAASRLERGAAAGLAWCPPAHGPPDLLGRARAAAARALGAAARPRQAAQRPAQLGQRAAAAELWALPAVEAHCRAAAALAEWTARGELTLVHERHARSAAASDAFQEKGKLLLTPTKDRLPSAPVRPRDVGLARGRLRPFQQWDETSPDDARRVLPEGGTQLAQTQLQDEVGMAKNKAPEQNVYPLLQDGLVTETHNAGLGAKVEQFASSAHALIEELRLAASAVSGTRADMDCRVLKLQDELQRASSERDDATRDLAAVKKLLDLSDKKGGKLEGSTEVSRVEAENLKTRAARLEHALRTERAARELADEQTVLHLSNDVRELRDECARKETTIQEQMRKIEADRLHFNKVLADERRHAEEEGGRLRGEMLQRLQQREEGYWADQQAREKRYQFEKEQVGEDQYSRGIDAGRAEGCAQARVELGAELSELRVERQRMEQTLETTREVFEAERAAFKDQIDGLLQHVCDLQAEVSSLTDNCAGAEAETQLLQQRSRALEAQHQANASALEQKISELHESLASVTERLTQASQGAADSEARADECMLELKEAEIRACRAEMQLRLAEDRETFLAGLVGEAAASGAPEAGPGAPEVALERGEPRITERGGRAGPTVARELTAADGAHPRQPLPLDLAPADNRAPTPGINPGKLPTQEQLARGALELAQHQDWVQLLSCEDQHFAATLAAAAGEGQLLPREEHEGGGAPPAAQLPSGLGQPAQRGPQLALAAAPREPETGADGAGQREQLAGQGEAGGTSAAAGTPLRAKCIPPPLQDEPAAGRGGAEHARGPSANPQVLSVLLAQERAERNSTDLSQHEGWVMLLRQEYEAYEGLRKGSAPGARLLEKPLEEDGRGRSSVRTPWPYTACMELPVRKLAQAEHGSRAGVNASEGREWASVVHEAAVWKSKQAHKEEQARRRIAERAAAKERKAAAHIAEMARRRAAAARKQLGQEEKCRSNLLAAQSKARRSIEEAQQNEKAASAKGPGQQEKQGGEAAVQGKGRDGRASATAGPLRLPSHGRVAPHEFWRGVKSRRATFGKGQSLLPPQRRPGRKTIVFDLDETLVKHRAPKEGAPACASDGLYFRRGAVALLQRLARGGAEVIVWTAGTVPYAEPLMTLLDPGGVVEHLVARHSVWYQDDESYTKDLRRLGRGLSSVILIDNNPQCAARTPANTLIVPDYDEEEDGGDSVCDRLHHLLTGWLASDASAAEWLAQEADKRAVDTYVGGIKQVPHIRPGEDGRL